MEISNHDIELVKELKDFINRYNYFYFKHSKDEFVGIMSPLPKIGFEIKDREKFRDIKSNYDNKAGEFYDGIAPDKEIRDAAGLKDYGILFSVAFRLNHKQILWRVIESTNDFYVGYSDSSHNFQQSLNNSEFRSDSMYEVVNYIMGEITKTYEKFPPGSLT